MTKVEMLAKIELLNRYEAMLEEIKAEADSTAIPSRQRWKPEKWRS